MAECGLFDFGCKAGNVAGEALGSAIENMAKAVMEGFGKAVASLGTLWVNIGTPNLTGSGSGSSSIAAGSAAGGSENLTTVLGYMMWIGFAVAAGAVIALGALVATRARHGEGIAAVGRIGLILAGVILIGASSGLVGALLPSEPRSAGGAVLFLQSSLWWYMAAGAVASIVIGGIRMAWEQRAEPGRELLRSLLTLVVVAGAGVTIVGLLVSAADSFSVWLINGSLKCDVSTDGACFGENMLNLLALTTNPAAPNLGSLLIIILGLIAILATVFQIILMVARGGMLVILTGVLPLAASATNTEMGKSWFKKCVSWLVAFILYKPAAAIVYAAAFQLVGTDVFKDDGSGLLAVLTGLMLMVIALFAMPALMRFVTPMVGAMAAGGGGAMLGAAAMAALPTGAAAIGRLASGSGGGGSATQGPGGPTGSPGPTGSTSDGSSPSRTAPAPGPKGGATAGGPAGSVPASGGVGAAAGAGAGGAGAGAAAAGGGAAAGAAAGPVGAAAGAALDVGKAAGQAAVNAARSLGEQATGEGGGPDGSR